MGLNRNFAFGAVFLGVSSFCLTDVTLSYAGPDKNPAPTAVAPPTTNLVQQYLTNDLKVAEPDAFDLSLKLKKTLDKISASATDPDAAKREFALKYFSPKSAHTLGKIFRAFGRTEYANAIGLGLAGVGKTFLLDQITALFSGGYFPDYMKPALGFQPDRDGKDSPFEMLRSAFIGKTNVVLIDSTLLSQDNTKHGQPWSSEDSRMRSVLAGLFNAAKQEFQQNHRRTIFIMDEVATLSPLVQQTLKKILDGTGFHNPNDSFYSQKDFGYHVLALTTPDEYRDMVKGDSAVERRYEKVSLNEPDEEEAFNIVAHKAEAEWIPLYGLAIQPKAIQYLIHMRKLLNNPPLAMPASVLAATNGLFLWKMDHPTGNPAEIDLKDAQTFLIKKAGLTKLWLEGPNGEPPFHGLANEVKKYVIGQDEVVDKIADRIQAWGRLNFGGEVPIFFLGGPSGSGKDTLVKAFNRVLFGHSGNHLMFSLGGVKGFGINAIIEGPPRGNHSDADQGLLVQALENGPPNGIIAFNEGNDAPSEELEKFKVFIESGEIRPKGKDSRVRPLYFPVFVLGQWGESYFSTARTDEDYARIYSNLNQERIEQAFLDGKDDGTTGSVSRAILDRAKRTGGVFMLCPVAQSKFASIVEISLEQLKLSLKTKKNIALSTTPALVEFVMETSRLAGEGPRGLGAALIDFTETAISKAMDEGLPGGDIEVLVDHQVDPKLGTDVIVLKSGEKSWAFAPRSLRRTKMGCEEGLI